MLTFRAASDQSLLVSFGGWSRDALRCNALLRVPGIWNLHPAYESLLIVFDSLTLDHAEVEAQVRELLHRPDRFEGAEPRTVEIPVAYGGENGPDLEDVAAHCGMSAGQVIEVHSAAVYTVYFIGFVPGFAYLGELPEQLATPRLRSPRKHVPVGSVAIGGRQTGVYPMSTPGGWRLIGRTALELFNPTRESMSLLEAGDRVRFVPV